MNSQFVMFKGEKIEVDQNVLDLSHQNISKIGEIEGLETLTNIQILKLGRNKIEKIEGLETLTNLQELDCSYNRIKKIIGLEKLFKLQNLPVHISNGL